MIIHGTAVGVGRGCRCARCNALRRKSHTEDTDARYSASYRLPFSVDSDEERLREMLGDLYDPGYYREPRVRNASPADGATAVPRSLP
jgi:hypothetical protein